MAKLLKLKTKKKNQNEDEMNFDEFNEEDKSKKIGVDSLIDSEAFSEIVPFSFEEKLDYIITGDKYVRSLPIIDYPKEKHGNWLSELRRKKGEISIVQYIESSPAKKMQDHYNRTIKNKEAELLNTHDPIRKKRIQKQIDSANYQLDKYMDSEAIYVYIYMYIYLQANSLEELNNLTDSVEITLQKAQLKPLKATRASYQAFWSAMPISENLLHEYTYKEANTETASSMFPYDDAEILNLTPKADVEGVNKDTDSLIAIDYTDAFKTLNQNKTIIGTSGVGKSTYMKSQILRNATKLIKQFIIDPENEYSGLVEMLGGSVVTLSSTSSTRINPLQVYSRNVTDDERTILDNKTIIQDKINRVLALFKALKPDLTQVERSILDTILNRIYEEKNFFTRDNIENLKPEEYPILADVYEKISKLKDSDSREDKERYEIIKDFYFILDSYVNGSSAIFNGYTNIDLKNRLISFNLLPLQNETNVQGAAYLNTFSFLWDEITNNKEQCKFYCDEFHFLLMNPNSADFFFNAYKRFRKYNAGAIAGTQNVEDVLDAKLSNDKKVGEAIVANSYTKVFFGMDKNQLNGVMSKLGVDFSQKEQKRLKGKKQRQAIIIYGSQRAFLDVRLTKEELRLLNPKEYQREYNEDPNEVPNYKEQVSLSKYEIEELKDLEF
ncbi:VirB4 family type IV secretion system protein [Staphylococcus aureus]|uniref:VirB4 family type IV secretion system protein n=1 Tax=Staphylococcus aureus TaxID=1280 RepID=UPI000A3479ED|nr:DUF87 domain-containing protein [Staphylococcus aureus]MDK4011975.1 DUF87 domain-containing protein [Staphylococcus pseudintermedius]